MLDRVRNSQRIALTHVRGGCLRDPPKAPRVKRFIFLAALGAFAVISGSGRPAQAADSKIANTFVRAGQDVEIKELRTYGTSDAIAGTNDEYYVIRFKFTNNVGVALVPRIDHFVIQDLQNRRYLGVEIGNAALIGISNYTGELARGDSHDYTVGFRVPTNTQGIIFYDASF